MQKRRIFLCIVTVVLVLMLAMCLFVACNDDDQKKPNDDNKGDDTPTTITITYDFNDGVTPNRTVTVGYDEHLKAEHIPSVSRVGYTFDGWFKGEERVRTNNHYTESFTAVARYTLKDVRVIFVDGETRTPVTIKYGQKVAEESFPEIDDQEGRNFLGWFIKDTDPAVEFDKDYVVNSETDIEVVATYETDKFNVIFKLNADDEDAYKTVSDIEHGSTIAETDLPHDPTTDDPTMKFSGWVDPDDDTVVFDKTAPITEGKTYVAKFVKFKYVVRYNFAAEDENRTDGVHYLEFDEDGNATLGALNIPQPKPVLSDPVRNFIGFYTSANVKAVAGMTITADTTFDAYYVGAIDYKGAWVDKTNNVVVYFDTDNGNMVSIGTYIFNKAFSMQDGSAVYTATFNTSWKFTLFKGKITATETLVGGETHTYTLTQGSKLAYQGVYNKDNNSKLIVGEGGVAFIGFGDNAVCGTITKTGNNYSIAFVDENENNVTVPATLDSKGSFVVASGDYASKYAGLWVKGAFANAYNGADGSKITAFTSGGNTVYALVPAEGAYKYVTPDKDIEANAIVTFTYDTNKTIIARFTSNTAYEIAGAERGTYTAEDTDNHVTYTIVLDGFGKATFDATGLPDDQNNLLGEWDYRAKSDNFVVINKLGDSDNLMFYGLNLNKANNSFTFEEPGNFTGVYSLMQGGTFNLTLTFDGFGSVIAYNANADITRYGTYVVDENANTVTVSDIGGAMSQFTDGVYTILQNGDVLSVTNAITETVEYWGVKDAVLPNVIPAKFNGTWENEDGTYKLIVTGQTAKVNLNDSDVDATLKLAESNAITLTVGETDIMFTLDGGKVTFSHQSENIVLSKVVLTDAASNYFGWWKWTNSQDPNDTILLHITRFGVTFNGNEAQDVSIDAYEDLSFSYNGTTYTGNYHSGILRFNDGAMAFNSSKDPDAFDTFPTAFIGYWKNNDVLLVIGESELTLGTDTVTEFTIVERDAVFAFTLNGVSYQISMPDTQILIENKTNSSSDTYTRDNSFDVGFVGEWIIENDNSTKVIMNITENGLTFDGKTATDILRKDSNTYEFKIEGKAYELAKPRFGSMPKLNVSVEEPYYNEGFIRNIVKDNSILGKWTIDDSTVFEVKVNEIAIGNDDIYDIVFAEDGNNVTITFTHNDVAYVLAKGENITLKTGDGAPVQMHRLFEGFSEQVYGGWQESAHNRVLKVRSNELWYDGVKATNYKISDDMTMFGYTKDGSDYWFKKDPNSNAVLLWASSQTVDDAVSYAFYLEIDSEYRVEGFSIDGASGATMTITSNSIAYITADGTYNATDITYRAGGGYNFKLAIGDAEPIDAYILVRNGKVYYYDGIGYSGHELYQLGWENFKVGTYTGSNYYEGDITVEITANSIIIDGTTYTSYDDKTSNSYKFGYDGEEYEYVLENYYGWTITDSYGDSYTISGLTRVE